MPDPSVGQLGGRDETPLLRPTWRELALAEGVPEYVVDGPPFLGAALADEPRLRAIAQAFFADICMCNTVEDGWRACPENLCEIKDHHHYEGELT